MTTLRQLERAFLKAHEEGDTENARILAEELQRLTAPPTVEEPVPQPQTGFMPNVKAGIERLKSDYYAGLASLGREGAAEEAEKHRKKAAAIATTPEFTEHPLEFVTSLLGQSVPYMAAPLAAGAVASPFGALAGMGAAGAASAAQFTGSNLSRQLEEGTRPEELQLGKAAAAAIPQAALDVVGLRYIPGIRNLLGRAGIEAGEEEVKGIVNKYIIPAFKTAGVEGGTEAAQQVFERLQAGLSITDPEARKEYFDNFIGGAVLGGTLSIPGSYLEGGRKAPPPEQPTAVEPAAITPEAAAPQITTPEQLALPAPEVAPQLGYSPTKLLPAPPEKYDIYDLMDHHETLKNSLDPLADQIEAARKAGDSEKARALVQEYRDNETAMNTLKTKIEELGGFTEPREEVEGAYAKSLKAIDAKISKLQNTINEMSRADVRDYDAVDKAEKQIEKLKAQRAAAEEEFRRKQEVLKVKETPAGEQIPLFAAEEAQPKATEPLKFKTETGGEMTAKDIEQAAQGPQRPDQVQIDAAAKKAVAQREEVLKTRQQELDSLMLDEYNDNVAREKARKNELLPNERQPMDAYNRAHHEERLHQAALKVRQLQNEIDALKEGTPTKTVAEKAKGKFSSDELYGDFNILNTAIQNQDRRTIDRVAEMRRKADLAAFNALHSKLTPREEVYELLKDRIGGILRREKNYDTYEATINDERVELSVSEEAAKEIKRLRNIVEAPRSRVVNGKKVPVRSMLQQLHDLWDDYNTREAQLKELKKAKAEPARIAKKKAQVEKAKQEYQKVFNRVAGYRQQLDAELKKLYNITGEFAPAPGLKGEPTIKTPRQKQEELEKLGRSARETSRQVKAAGRAQAGKVKLDTEKVAKELGEKTEEYAKYAAPRLKTLKTKADQYNKFLEKGKDTLAKLKAKFTDAEEIARVEKELQAAIKERDAVPAENPIEKEKAEKKVNSLTAHLAVVKTPKDEKYKTTEANFVKVAQERLAAFKAFEAPILADLQAKAVELGKAAPEFKDAVAKAQEKYSETVAAGEQQIKSLRTPQVTRKIAKLSSMQTSSEESKSETQRRQETFEAGLSEAKGEAYDYQQRQEAIERTKKAREAKEAKGTAMKVALTEAAQEKLRKEALAGEKKRSDIQALAAYDTAAALGELKEKGKFARGVEVESPDLTAAQISMIDDNNVVGVLRSIANDPKASEINRAVAQRLAVMLDNTDIEIHDKLFATDGTEVLGEAVSTKIKLSRNGGLSQEVLLHEGTHSAVERVIQMPDSMLTKEQIIAKRELEAMFKAIQKDASITSANAKSSLSEFAAEIFSNKNLQEQLRKKPWRGSTLWEGLKSVILRLLGVKVPENMLGNALKAVDVMLIPSSQRYSVTETPANRNYSAKDIAALHTGSNSMKQFAEQFQLDIKQADRTVEDVERIASERMKQMETHPDNFIAYPKLDKINIAQLTRMEDGRIYDPNNPYDYFTASPEVIMYGNMTGNAARFMLDDVGANRAAALQTLAQYLQTNPDYTAAEMALVAKAASKYGVISGKDGKLKLVMLDASNMHPVSVVGRDSANAIVEELRKGKSLKDAFFDGMVAISERNQKKNLGRQGWKKFAQSDSYEAAVELNAGAAGTTWCTGASVDTAKGQLSNGDFYIYYNNGRPEVAIRMNGAMGIGEIRGNTSNQSLNSEQQKIALDYINKRDFSGANRYFNDIELRAAMARAVKTNTALTPEEVGRLLNDFGYLIRHRLEDLKPEIYDERDLYMSPTAGVMTHLTVMGYGAPPPSAAVAKAGDRILAKSFANAYKNKHLAGFKTTAYNDNQAVVATVANPFLSKAEKEENTRQALADIEKIASDPNIFVSTQHPANVDLVGRMALHDPEAMFDKILKRVGAALEDEHSLVFVHDLKDIKTIGVLSISHANNDIELSSLEYARELEIKSNDNVVQLPSLKQVSYMSVKNDGNEAPPVVDMPDGAVVGSITPDKPNTSLLLSGNPIVHSVHITSGEETLHLVAPDVTRIDGVVETIQPTDIRRAAVAAIQEFDPEAFDKTYLLSITPDGKIADLGQLDLTKFYTEDEIHEAWMQSGYDADTFENESELIRQFIRDGSLPNRIPQASKKEPAWRGDKKVAAVFIEKTLDDLRSFIPKSVFDKLSDSLSTNEAVAFSSYLIALFDAYLEVPTIPELRARTEELRQFMESRFASLELLERMQVVSGSIEAPERVLKAAEQITDADFVEVQEQPRYAPKDIGVQKEKPGVFSFKSFKEPAVTSSSIVADDQSNIDYLKSNFLGLRGRVQMVDKFAAISEAFKKGLEAGKINALEASNAEYYLRFGEQRSQYAQQALTNGPMKRVVSRTTDAGKEYIYRSEKGANLMSVFQTLSDAGIKNSAELDRMFTVYQAGLRAEQPNVGWEKLWVGNPAKAKAEHAEVMKQLDANPKMKAAFLEASREYREFNNGLLDFLVQTGAMTQELADKLKATPYVPYYRVNKGSGDVELFTDKEHPIRIGNIKDEPQLQELVGDNTQILPLSVSAVQNAFILTDMALRNQRVKDTSFLLHKIGIAKALGRGQGPANRDTVHFKVKGEPYYAIIDTDLYGIPADLIIKGMEGIKTTLPFAVKAMGIPADLLRKFVTRNPAYAIKQAIRDPLTAWMTTGADGVPVLNSFKELSSMVAGRSEAERKLMESGAISSNVFTGDKGDMQRFLRDISAGKSGWEKLMAKADAFALQGDAATRAVIYKDSIAKGMSEQQALLRTLESMNFGRRGLSPTMHFLNTMIPFFNAQVQGLDVLYRAFKGQMPYSEQLKIREKLLARGLMLSIGTLAYAAMMQDDEAYKRAKPEERLGNWFVYIPGTNEPLKIPIPFELGYLFKSLPEAVFNMAADDEKSQDITKGMGKLVALSNPVGLPQGVKPVVELYLGKSFFGGDIESQREQKTMLPTERARESTTEVAKLLGSVTGDAGITPIGWDHLTRGYTGSLGIALVSLANPLLNTEVEGIEKPSKKMHETPFIGGLFQPVEGRGTLDAAYERMLEIQQAKGTFDRLLQEGRKEEAKEFLEEYRTKVANASLSGAMQQKLGELATLKRRVIGMANMPQEKKDELIERLDAQQVLLARKFLSVTDGTTPPASRP